MILCRAESRCPLPINTRKLLRKTEKLLRKTEKLDRIFRESPRESSLAMHEPARPNLFNHNPITKARFPSKDKQLNHNSMEQSSILQGTNGRGISPHWSLLAPDTEWKQRQTCRKFDSTPCQACTCHLPRSHRSPFCLLTWSGWGQELSQLPCPLSKSFWILTHQISSSYRLLYPFFSYTLTLCINPILSLQFFSPLVPSLHLQTSHHRSWSPSISIIRYYWLSLVILSPKQITFLTSLLLPNSQHTGSNSEVCL